MKLILLYWYVLVAIGVVVVFEYSEQVLLYIDHLLGGLNS